MKRKVSNAIYGLLIFAILVLALVIGLWFFNNVAKPFCEEYEASRLTYNINEYMEELNSTKWNNDIAAAADNLVNDFQDKEEVENIVREYLQRGDITQKMSGVGDETKFTLSSVKEENGEVTDVQTIGSVTFGTDQNFVSALESGPAKLFTKIWPFSMASGFKPNYYSSEQFNFDFMKATGTQKIQVPDGFTVTVNGKEVGEEYKTGEQQQISGLESLYESYPDLVKVTEYEIPNLVGGTDIVIYDSEGKEFTVDKTGSVAQYGKACTDAEMSEIRDFVNDGFISAYVNFWGTKWVDSTYGQLMNFVLQNSPMQQEMYEYTLDAATWIHTNSIAINSAELTDAKSLGGDLYAITITVNTTAYAEGKDPVTEDSTKTILLTHDEDGNLKAISKA